ncbi:MAG: peptidoglycan DD-metalloendopeptidase family protein [Pseudomonadales bacterium]|nr:peptidoglycan DD-metalloendopeptidase family protein [Pseudomonadales bacterium]
MLVLLACGVHASPASFAANSSSADTNNTQSDQRKLKALKAEIRQVKKRLNQFKGKRAGLVASLQQVEVAMGTLETAIAKNRKQVRTSQSKLRKFEVQKTQLVFNQTLQKKLIEKQLAQHYKMGQEPYIKQLFSEQEPQKMSRLSRYYGYFNRARLQQIEKYQASIVALKELQQHIQTEAGLLANKQRSLTQQHQSLAEKSAHRKTLVAKLNQEIRSGNQRLGTLDADQKRLQSLLTTLAKTTADLAAAGFSQSFPTAKGTLAWPTNGTITRRYGSKQKPSNLRWKGVTLNAKQGADVRSIHHGQVIFSGWLRGHGLLIVVEHNQHYMSIYAHNQTLLREEGDWVTAGELIATVGMTGGQELSALYFEIRKDGNPLNPELWCSSGR